MGLTMCEGKFELKKAKKSGAPGETRTHDLLLRRQTLYPTELRVQISEYPLIYPSFLICQILKCKK